MNEVDITRWEIRRDGEVWIISDPSGRVRGRYSSVNELARHMAMAIQEMDRMGDRISAAIDSLVK